MKKCDIMTHFPADSLVQRNKTFLIELLNIINSCDTQNFKKFLIHANDSQIETLVEIAKNFLNGNFPKNLSSKLYLKRMLTFRKSLHKIASQRITFTAKRRHIISNQKGGALIASLLIPIVGSLLSGLISKNI